MTVLRWHAFVERNRLAILGATVLVTLLAILAARHIQVDSRISIWFLDDDPDVAVYDEFISRFGGDETVVVLLRPGDALDPDFIDRLDRVTRAVQGQEGVLDVVSLTSAITMPGT